MVSEHATIRKEIDAVGVPFGRVWMRQASIHRSTMSNPLRRQRDSLKNTNWRRTGLKRRPTMMNKPRHDLPAERQAKYSFLCNKERNSEEA